MSKEIHDGTVTELGEDGKLQTTKEVNIKEDNPIQINIEDQIVNDEVKNPGKWVCDITLLPS